MVLFSNTSCASFENKNTPALDFAELRKSIVCLPLDGADDDGGGEGVATEVTRRLGEREGERVMEVVVE